MSMLLRSSDRFRLMVMAAVLLAGCAGAASETRTTVNTPVTTTADALARVVEREPRFSGVKPFDTGLVGQSSWYTVEPASGVGAFIVTMRIGWGDCEAGCIGEHRWVFTVAPDGAVALVSERGVPVPADAWPTPP